MMPVEDVGDKNPWWHARKYNREYLTPEDIDKGFV